MWLTIDEACKSLGLSKRTIWRRIEDGSLPSKEEGGRRLVQVEASDEEAEIKPLKEEKKKEGTRRTSQLLLDLTESLFDLLQEIRKRTQESVDIARIVENWSDGDREMGWATRWIEVFEKVEGVYKKVQEPETESEEFKDLFPKLLKARGEVETLENEKIRSLEWTPDGVQLDDDTLETVKMRRRARDRLLSILEEIIGILKKMIVMSQEGEV
jgi:excisionase family DNA binding protein